MTSRVEKNYNVIIRKNKQSETHMKPIPLQKEKDQDQAIAIFPIFQAWSSFSKKGDYSSMLALCVPNSEFAEISNLCKRSGDIGIRFYYEFENLVVISILDDGSKADVKGDIKLIQMSSRNVFAGHFRASCHMGNHHTTGIDLQIWNNWKLGNIDIEWED